MLGERKHFLDFSLYEGVCNVEYNFRTYFDLLLNKVSSLFIWKNLPETVDERFLEFQLLLHGKCCFVPIDGNYYVLDGNIGGEPNCYYEPTKWIVANPVLGSKTVTIRDKYGSHDVSKVDGILIGNSDTDYESLGLQSGIAGLMYQTAGLLADNISSLNIAQINGRLSTLFVGDSEELARTGEKILQDIYSGKPYKILTEDLVEKFSITPASNNGINNTLMSLIEAHQYILAQFFQEIGVSANYNMKRERLNTAEVEMNNGALDNNIFNMLKNRQQAVERINEKFGLDITVELNFAVFNEENGNADAETEEQEETPMEIDQSDDELQIDGVEEDSTDSREDEQDGQEEETESENDSNDEEEGEDE